MVPPTECPLQLPGSDVFPNHLRQNPLGVKLGDFGQNAAPGGRGEGDESADQPSVNNRVEVKCFFRLFVGHEVGQVSWYG